jgi:hypothetical protein
MATAAVIGELLAIQGYALAGAAICPADGQSEAAAAWDALPPTTALVILTASAAAWLADRLGQRPDVLTAVIRP